MKLLLTCLALISITAINAQGFTAGGHYVKSLGSSDSTKTIYKQGGGLEGFIGFTYKKTAIIGSAGIDVLKLKTPAGSTKKDGWINLTAGIKQYLTQKAMGKNFSGAFIAGNYGISANNYTSRTANVKTTTIWNAGAGIHIQGVELSYFYHTMQDKKFNRWFNMSQIKIGLALIN
jgi:hypothetical protein